MNLDGVWRFAPATDKLRRDAVGLDTDDQGWAEITVPGHWRTHPDFADHDGPFLHRKAYALAPPAPDRRRWVTLDGVMYQADVWLDGAYLGDPEGYFTPHSFDITALSRIGNDHVLAVEVACPPQHGTRDRRNITGIYQEWDGIDRNWNPGGLWGNVRIYDTGPARIDRFRVICRDADQTRAHLLLHAAVDCDRARAATIVTRVDGNVVRETDRWMAAGANDLHWKIDIAEPDLWWPRKLGDQPLTTFEVEILIDGLVSDSRRRRTGLRKVAWNDWSCSINGERLYLKGANLLPSRLDVANTPPGELRKDIELAAQAGLNVVRVHGHVARRELYDAADELGILILQDFPLQWGYARSVKDQAVFQATAMVDHLGHHPSIVQWSAHNDPAAAAIGLEGDSWKSRLRFIAGQQLPTWNKTVLDRWVKRAIENADPTRMTIAHSGMLPNLPLLDGTDSHFYFGWHHGQAGDLTRLSRAMPRLVRFLSEFGAQALPDTDHFVDADSWPDLDWAALSERHGLQKERFDLHVPPARYPTYDEWKQATQRYQAFVIKYHVEFLRRIKYQPAGGFCMFALNDPGPMVSFSVLDHKRLPKLGFAALRDACEPVLVTLSEIPRHAVSGDVLRLSLHIVNDLRTPVVSAVATATARWGSEELAWSFGGEVAADSCEKVGTISLAVPRVDGTIELTIELAGSTPDGEHVCTTNRYTVPVIDSPGGLPSKRGEHRN